MDQQATLKVSVTRVGSVPWWYAQVRVDHPVLNRPWKHTADFPPGRDPSQVIAGMVELTEKLATMHPENLRIFVQLEDQNASPDPAVTASAVLAADGPVGA